MFRNTRIAVVALAACASLGAWYGGWATVTVENLPDQLVAGTPYNMTFSVRQHGDNLLTDLHPYLELKSKGNEQKVRAVATNKAGYYTATLNVPETGDWHINIETSFGKSNLKLLPIAAVASASSRAVSLTNDERGRRLFVAKGCASCHMHAKVEESGRYKAGPDLSDKRFAAAYLRDYLANPAIKPPTTTNRMPKLNLSGAEIAALTSFINSDAPVRTAQQSR